MDELIQALKAVGEPTRLRIVATLDRTELTVSELCRILGQSQPRVSRHLKLLCDAGLLTRHAEGTSAYYRSARSPFAKQFLSSLSPLIDRDDAVLARDRSRLGDVRSERAEVAARSREKIAAEAAVVGPRSAPAVEVEKAMLELIGDAPIRRLIDIGTGTGRVLELLGPRVESGLGVELNREMLNVARTTLDARRLGHCRVRLGNAYDLDAAIGGMDLAVFHQMLHFLDAPATAIEQAAGTLVPGGKLLVVDFAPHGLERLRTEHEHRRLGFADDEVVDHCEATGLRVLDVVHCEPPPDTDHPDEPLTITLWLAERPASTRPTYAAEVA